MIFLALFLPSRFGLQLAHHMNGCLLPRHHSPQDKKLLASVHRPQFLVTIKAQASFSPSGVSLLMVGEVGRDGDATGVGAARLVSKEGTRRCAKLLA